MLIIRKFLEMVDGLS